MGWTQHYLLQDFVMDPNIEERGRVLRGQFLLGQALQVPGTSSAGPMNQIERVQYLKCIFGLVGSENITTIDPVGSGNTSGPVGPKDVY